MNTTIAHTLDIIRIGSLVHFRNLTTLPLFSSNGSAPEFISMKQGLSSGAVQITEVSEGGNVPNLKVANKGDVPVLLLDGEEIKGAKQNRVINTSILIGAHSETVIPVSCTEQGRWNYTTAMFSDSGFIMPSRSRMSKNTRVAANMMAGRGHDAEQREVWREVDQYHQTLHTHSNSGALFDAFEQKKGELDDFLKAFPLEPDQQGLIVLLNGRPVGADFIARKEVYADLHDKLVRSFAMDALTQPIEQADAADQAIAAHRFLHSLEKAGENKFQAVGLGEDFRFDGPETGGSALVYADCTVHLNIYPKMPGNNAPGFSREERQNPLGNFIRRRF